MTSWIEKGVRCLKSNKSAGGFFTDENIDSLEILREYMRYLISHYQPLVAAGGRVNFTTIPSISRREMQEGIMTSREAWDLQRLFEDIVARKETTHAFLIGSVSHWLTIVVNKKSKAQTNNATKSRLAADKPNTRSNGAGVLSTCRADSDDVKHQQCQGQGRKQGPGESDSSVTGLDELKNELEILFFESYNIPLLSRSDKQVFEYLKQHLINDIPAYARRLRSRDAFKNKTDEEMKHIIYNGHEGGKVWSSAFVRPMSQRCNRWYRSCIDTRTSIELIHDCATGRKQFNEVYMSAIVDGICNLFAVADPASAVAKSIANATTTDDNVKSLPVPTLGESLMYMYVWFSVVVIHASSNYVSYVFMFIEWCVFRRFVGMLTLSHVCIATASMTQSVHTTIILKPYRYHITERQISYAGVETWLLSDRRSFHPSSIKRGIFVTMCELGRKYLTNKKATQLVKWTGTVKQQCLPQVYCIAVNGVNHAIIFSACVCFLRFSFYFPKHGLHIHTYGLYHTSHII